MSGPRHACHHCGYSLDGVRPGDGGVTCPECGHAEPAAVYALAPWPAPWRVALRMLWPTASLVSLLVAMLALRPLLWMLMIGWPMVLTAWLLAALVHPVFEAGELARRHALIPERWRVRAVLGSAAMAMNAGMTLVGLWLLAHLR